MVSRARLRRRVISLSASVNINVLSAIGMWAAKATQCQPNFVAQNGGNTSAKPNCSATSAKLQGSWLCREIRTDHRLSRIMRQNICRYRAGVKGSWCTGVSGRGRFEAGGYEFLFGCVVCAHATGLCCDLRRS